MWLLVPVLSIAVEGLLSETTCYVLNKTLNSTQVTYSLTYPFYCLRSTFIRVCFHPLCT